MRVLLRGQVAVLIAVGVTIFASGCGQRDGQQTGAGGNGPSTAAPTAASGDRPRLPRELSNPARTPEAAVFLPPLEGYRTADDVETGEERASLDHSNVPYVEVRRRLILDEQGLQLGAVTIITLRAEANAAEQVLKHEFGDASRMAVEVAGVDMLLVEAQPHRVLAWTGPTFAVIFERGQEKTHEWLQRLAGATVAAMRE